MKIQYVGTISIDDVTSQDRIEVLTNITGNIVELGHKPHFHLGNDFYSMILVSSEQEYVHTIDMLVKCCSNAYEIGRQESFDFSIETQSHYRYFHEKDEYIAMDDLDYLSIVFVDVNGTVSFKLANNNDTLYVIVES